MLKLNEKNQVNAKDIYDFVEVKTRFDMWVKRCIDYADLQENKDFCTVLGESTGGRPAKEFYFILDAAKEMCIVSATSKAKELRRWLIEISNQVQNSNLLSHTQILEIIRLVKIFAVYEFRKKATENNFKNFESNFNENKKYIYANFHKWRNEILNLGKEELEKRILDYF
jgi:phage anti-repressor protein